MIQKKYVPHSILLNAHLCGIIGLLSPYKEFFMLVTPLNLILSGLILFYYHKDFNRSFLLFASLIFILGYLVELLGVKTGKIFGEYSYGKTLGFKLFDIPVIMGLNWLNLVYSAGVIFQKTKFHFLIKALLGALVLTFLDLFIEPVAIAYDFWSWEAPAVPIQNYIAWFLFSFFFLVLFYVFTFKKENKISLFYLLIQLGFFFLLSCLV